MHFNYKRHFKKSVSCSTGQGEPAINGECISAFPNLDTSKDGMKGTLPSTATCSTAFLVSYNILPVIN